MIDKDIVEAHKGEFVGKDILGLALEGLIKENKGEAISGAKKLYAKEYQTRREIKDLEEKLKKAQDSLIKTLDKIKKVEGDDLSALFEGQKED